MKTYIAEPGKTFVDEKGVNYGTTIRTTNINKFHQIDLNNETIYDKFKAYENIIEEKRKNDEIRHQELLKTKTNSQ